MDYNEKQKILLLKKGNVQVFDEIYRKYSPKLYNFIFTLSKGNQYIAEEIVQSTFVKIWSSRESIDETKSFISFLFTIAKNKLLNQFEHQTIVYVYTQYILANSLEYTEYNGENDTDYNLLNSHINELIERLPPARARIFTMSKVEHKSNKDIAKELNISVSTVETQLSKSLQFMRSSLKKYYEITLLLMALIVK